MLFPLPTYALDMVSTPFVKLFGYVPNEKHLRVFGCDTYALIYDDERRKHGPRGKKGIYVGQPSEATGYLFYNPETQFVTITNHVLFNEDTASPRQWTEEEEKTLFQEMYAHEEKNTHDEDIPQSQDMPQSEEKPQADAISQQEEQLNDQDIKAPTQQLARCA